MIIDNNKFNSLLKQKGLKKSLLSSELSISSKTMAKVKKGENIRDSVVQKIANYIGCQIEEIAKQNNIYLRLLSEKQQKISGGLYYATQIKLTFNSNHIEGSALTEEQTRNIFETKTLSNINKNVKIDDVIETNNHFKCIDFCIDNANNKLDEHFIKSLHKILKSGTDFEQAYGAGEYKIFPNTIGGIETSSPQNVKGDIKNLLKWYNAKKHLSLEDIVEFHYKFEQIHPFQDGNGRVGRLIAFKECLKNNIVPFYIDDNYKFEYYRGLSEWKNIAYLIETCKFGQDLYKILLDYFKVEY